MHEASLIRGLMEKVTSLAVTGGARRVTNVRVWLGAFSHMSAERFREHFERSGAGTIVEVASLEIEESADIDDPNADGLILRSIEIEE